MYISLKSVKQATFGSIIGLSPVRHQAIIANQCYYIVDLTLSNKIQRNLNQYIIIFIQEMAYS